MNKVYLNLGCGDTAPKNWVNCDSSWHAQLAKVPFLHSLFNKLGIVSNAQWPSNIKYFSINRRFPWGNDSVDCIYASHVLEHLTQRPADYLMAESYRVLKPGGVLRIVVPDLFYHARKYVDNWSDDKSGAEELLEVMHLRLPDENNIIRQAYNLLTGYPNLHKQMYDPVILKEGFLRSKFTNIVLSSYGKSDHITNISDVEYREDGYEGSIYMEGMKP